MILQTAADVTTEATTTFTAIFDQCVSGFSKAAVSVTLCTPEGCQPSQAAIGDFPSPSTVGQQFTFTVATEFVTGGKYCVTMGPGAVALAVSGAQGPKNLPSQEKCVMTVANFPVVAQAIAADGVVTNNVYQVTFTFPFPVFSVPDAPGLRISSEGAFVSQSVKDLTSFTYTIDVRGANNQDLTVSLPAGSVMDLSGVTNLESPVLSVKVAYPVDCVFEVSKLAWSDCVDGFFTREVQFVPTTRPANGGAACPPDSSETRECGAANCGLQLGVDCDCLVDTVLGNCCDSICRPAVCGVDRDCFSDLAYTTSGQADTLECHCDQVCHTHNDCCANFEEDCAASAPATLLPTVDGVNCATRCASETEFVIPGSIGEICTCSENCIAQQNCCDDFFQSCHHLVKKCGATLMDDGVTQYGDITCGIRFTDSIYKISYPDTCDCDPGCFERKTCCVDHDWVCRTCRHRCGENHPMYECQCDDNCAASNSCCPDLDGWCNNCIGWANAKSEVWTESDGKYCDIEPQGDPNKDLIFMGLSRVTDAECRDLCYHDFFCKTYMTAGYTLVNEDGTTEEFADWFCYLTAFECNNYVDNAAWNTRESVSEGVPFKRCGEIFPETESSAWGNCKCDPGCFERGDCCDTIGEDCSHLDWAGGQ